MCFFSLRNLQCKQSDLTRVELFLTIDNIIINNSTTFSRFHLFTIVFFNIIIKILLFYFNEISLALLGIIKCSMQQSIFFFYTYTRKMQHILLLLLQHPNANYYMQGYGVYIYRSINSKCQKQIP